MVFYMWGHGYELDYGTKLGNDEYLETIFKTVADAKDICFVTNAELISEVHAGLKKLLKPCDKAF